MCLPLSFPFKENLGFAALALQRELFVWDSHFMPAWLRSCVGASKLGEIFPKYGLKKIRLELSVTCWQVLLTLYFN